MHRSSALDDRPPTTSEHRASVACTSNASASQSVATTYVQRPGNWYSRSSNVLTSMPSCTLHTASSAQLEPSPPHTPQRSVTAGSLVWPCARHMSATVCTNAQAVARYVASDVSSEVAHTSTTHWSYSSSKSRLLLLLRQEVK